VTLRARWVTLRARWVTLRARWVSAKSLLRVFAGAAAFPAAAAGACAGGAGQGERPRVSATLGGGGWWRRGARRLWGGVHGVQGTHAEGGGRCHRLLSHQQPRAARRLSGEFVCERSSAWNTPRLNVTSPSSRALERQFDRSTWLSAFLGSLKVVQAEGPRTTSGAVQSNRTNGASATPLGPVWVYARYPRSMYIPSVDAPGLESTGERACVRESTTA
jgi:hypothetical protein